MSNVRPVNTTYEPFSREPEYIEANRAFVGRQSISNIRRILDLACGTGTLSELLLAAAPHAHLVGVDYDRVQIDLVTKHFQSLGYAVRHGFELTDDRAHDKPVLTFATGSADELPFPDRSFDCATIGNAIHMMPDKARFLRSVARVLVPGGVFGFNSSFYAGTIPPGGERHMFEWLKAATAHIDRKNEQRRAEGMPMITRRRGTARGAFQNRWLSPREWTDLLADVGLHVHDINERCVYLDERCLSAFGAYGGVAEVVMSGYPVAEASEALQATAGESLRNMGVGRLPRNWLEVWATKKA